MAKSKYFQVPNDIFDKTFIVVVKGQQRELSSTEKLVLIYIYRCSNNTESAFPSYTTIANKCGISRRTAINAVNVLADNKLIKKTWRKSPDVIDNKKNQTNVYQPSIGEYDAPLNIDSESGAPVEEEISEEVLPDGELSAPPSEVYAPPVVNEMHHPGAPDAPRRITTYKEPIKEEPIINKEAVFSLLEKDPEEIPEEELIILEERKHDFLIAWYMLMINRLPRQNRLVNPKVKVRGKDVPAILKGAKKLEENINVPAFKKAANLYLDSLMDIKRANLLQFIELLLNDPDKWIKEEAQEDN